MMTYVKTVLALLVAAAVLLVACEEVPPTLTLQEGGAAGPTSSELSEQPKGVLMEEFTGVRCVNCPAGAEAIAQFKVLYGERLVPISLHTGFFARPYTENVFDFRTPASDAIETFLGAPQGYPSAVIDRVVFSGETGLQVGRSLWAGYLSTRLAEEPSVGIGVTPTYDADAATLTVEVEWLGRAGLTDREAYLSVLLLENDLVDYQLTPDGKQADYVHKHALREALTAPTGDPIGVLTEGQGDTRTYTLGVPADYAPDNLEIAAYIHHADAAAGGKEVLQAVVKKVGE